MATQRAASDLRLAFRPSSSYTALAALDTPSSWLTAVQRVLLGMLLVGVSVAIAATGGVSPSLLLSTSASWSWVMVVQLAIAFAMTHPLPRDGRLTTARAIELWFAGHIPWTLWVLVLGPLLRLVPDLEVELLILSMVLPMAWTATIAAAFGRVVLRQSDSEAWLRAGLHQLVLLGVILSYVAWAAGGWFRIIG